jgi:hypothetical protein
MKDIFIIEEHSLWWEDINNEVVTRASISSFPKIYIDIVKIDIIKL